MSWIRECSEHLLASNLFDSAASERVFVHPLFLVSGAAVKLGAGIQLAVLAWKPIAVAVLLLGFAAYVRRHLPLGRPAGGAALLLALFMFLPFGLLLDWAGIADGQRTSDLTAMGSVLFLADELWGEPHLAIAAGLMPLFVLRLAGLFERDPSGPRRRPLDVGAIAVLGLLVSWLHPWKGVTLILLLAGGALWVRSWRPALAVVGAATAAPLAYYLVLSRADAAWKLAEAQSGGSRFPLWVVVVVLAPLAALAIAGARGPATGANEKLLRLWPFAALATYLAVSSGAFHAFEGMSLPLAVLCVRGWAALRLPAALAAAALLVVTVPGPLWELDVARKGIQAGGQGYYLTRDEVRALAYLEEARSPGPVLARPSLALTVPAFTGRGTWAAHPVWTPRHSRRAAEADALFEGGLPVQAARYVLRRSRARFVLADCHAVPAARRLIAGAATASRAFGCVTVHELPPAARHASWEGRYRVHE